MWDSLDRVLKRAEAIEAAMEVSKQQERRRPPAHQAVNVFSRLEPQQQKFSCTDSKESVAVSITAASLPPSADEIPPFSCKETSRHPSSCWQARWIVCCALPFMLPICILWYLLAFLLSWIFTTFLLFPSVRALVCSIACPSTSVRV